MPKPKRLTPTKKILVAVDEGVLNQVELLLIDTLTGKMRYGERTKLINRLLREWVDSKVGNLK